MHKSELTTSIAQAADLSEREADNALSAAIEQITNALARGESVALVGFGSFSVKNRAARTGRNPRTGKEINIAASNQISFKPGKQFKDAINNQ